MDFIKKALLEIATDVFETPPHSLALIAKEHASPLHVNNILHANFFHTDRPLPCPLPPSPALVAKLFELKFDLAVELVTQRKEASARSTILAFRDALFFHSPRDDVHLLPLSSPLATELYKRLHQKHQLVRQAREYENNFLWVWNWQRLDTHRIVGPMIVLSINLGWQPATLGIFNMIIRDYVSDSKNALDEGVLGISARLVETTPCANASFTPEQCDSLLMMVQRLEFKIYTRVMADLLRVPKIAEHDTRKVFIRTYEMVAAYSYLISSASIYSSASIHFAIQWLASQHGGDHCDDRSILYNQAVTLFRKSGPLTAVDAWRLVVRFSGDHHDGTHIPYAKSLLGLRIYHPEMSDSALRLFMWTHPLAASKIIHLREQHFRHLRNYNSHSKKKLQTMQTTAEVVRCVGGPAMVKLYGIHMPSRVAGEIVSYML